MSEARLVNGEHTDVKTTQVSISLSRSPGLVVNVHLQDFIKTTTLFVSCQALDTTQSVPAMGSFVYALPDRYNPSQPICTAIYTATPSIDFATRLARLLAHRLKKPCYVGSSISLTTSPSASTVEEEMEAFRAIVDVVLENARKLD